MTRSKRRPIYRASVVLLSIILALNLCALFVFAQDVHEIDSGVNTVEIPITIPTQATSYFGIQFDYTIDKPAQLSFDSFVPDSSLTGAMIVPIGANKFSFVAPPPTAANPYSATAVGKVILNYSGNDDVNFIITKATIMRDPTTGNTIENDIGDYLIKRKAANPSASPTVSPNQIVFEQTIGAGVNVATINLIIPDQGSNFSMMEFKLDTASAFNKFTLDSSLSGAVKTPETGGMFGFIDPTVSNSYNGVITAGQLELKYTSNGTETYYADMTIASYANGQAQKTVIPNYVKIILHRSGSAFTIVQNDLSRSPGAVSLTPKVEAPNITANGKYKLTATLSGTVFHTSGLFDLGPNTTSYSVPAFSTASLAVGTHVVTLKLLDANNTVVATKDVNIYVSSSSGGSGGGGGGGGGGGSSTTTSPTVRPSTETIPPDDTPSTTIVQPFMNGFSDGTLGPDKFLTRAQLAQLIYNLYGNNATTTQSQVFSDVSSSHWAFQPIMFCNEKGYMIGYENKIFKPDQNITRAEFTAAFARIKNIESTDATNFTDITGHWAFNYISGMTKEGVITGYTDNTFRPNNKITRAEAATIICRVNDYDETKYDSGKTFSDLSSGHWAYNYLMLATNGYNLTAEPTATPSPETTETPTPSASPSATA